MSEERTSVFSNPAHMGVFLLLLFLLIISRLVILWYSTGIAGVPEELANGVLPLHLERGLVMPWYMYQYEQYSGGTVITGLLAHAPFRLLDPTEFSLKLVPLFFSICLFVISFFFLRRFFDFWAAVFIGFAILVSPLHYLKSSLTAFGNHAELLAFLALGFAVFCTVVTRRTTNKSQSIFYFGLVFLFGIVSGFATYFDYIFLIFAFVPAAFALLGLSLGRTALFLIVFLLGFRAGLSPWYLYHHDESFLLSVYNFFSSGSAFGDASSLLPQIKTVAATVYRRWFGLPGWLNAGLWLTFLACYVCAIYKTKEAFRDFARCFNPAGRKPLAWTSNHLLVPVLIYFPVHLLAFALYQSEGSAPAPAFRYLLPLYFVFFVVHAVMLSDWWQRKKRIPFALVAIMLLLAGIASHWHLLSNSKAGFTWNRPGYDYTYFYGAVGSYYGLQPHDQELLLDEVVVVYPQFISDFFAGVTIGIAYFNGVEIDSHLAAAKAPGEKRWSVFVSGLGCAGRLARSPEPDRLFQVTSLFAPVLLDSFHQGESFGDRAILGFAKQQKESNR